VALLTLFRGERDICIGNQNLRHTLSVHCSGQLYPFKRSSQCLTSNRMSEAVSSTVSFMHVFVKERGLSLLHLKKHSYLFSQSAASTSSSQRTEWTPHLVSFLESESREPTNRDRCSFPACQTILVCLLLDLVVRNVPNVTLACLISWETETIRHQSWLISFPFSVHLRDALAVAIGMLCLSKT
jgi:hypothetical protein